MIKAEFVSEVTEKGYAEKAELFRLERPVQLETIFDFTETDHVVISYITSRTREDIPSGVKELALFASYSDGDSDPSLVVDVAPGITGKEFLERHGIELT